MDPNHGLSQVFEGFLTDASHYRQIVGKLVNLTYTRPNLVYPIQFLSQFMDKPTEVHLKATNRVLKYLKRAPG